MKMMKRILACALAVMLVVPSISSAVLATESSADMSEESVEDTPEVSEVPEESEVSEESEESVEDTPEEPEESVEDMPEEPEESVEDMPEESEESELPEESSEDMPEESEESEVPEEPEESSEDTTEESDTSDESEVQEISEETPAEEEETDEVWFNTGDYTVRVINAEAYEEAFNAAVETAFDGGEIVLYKSFDGDGNYTIELEDNAFFPYEVQFTHDGEVTTEWFETPGDSVEVDGHTFYVTSDCDGNALTQLSFEVGGETIVAYPEEKEFKEDADAAAAALSAELYHDAMPMSLLPLEESETALTVDLSGLTPIELTMVKVSAIFGETVSEEQKIVWSPVNHEDDYFVSGINDTVNLCYSHTTWDIIIGDGDQLNSDNIRYTLEVTKTSVTDWLNTVVYSQETSGARQLVATESEYEHMSYDHNEAGHVTAYYYNSTSADSTGLADKALYAGLVLNKDSFSDSAVTSMRAVEGWYDSSDKAVAALSSAEINVFSDMTQTGSGYALEDDYLYQKITLIAYDNAGSVIGVLPMQWHISTNDDYVRVSLYQDTTRLDYSYVYGEGYSARFDLEEKYALDGQYKMVLSYVKENSSAANPDLTAVYEGSYSSIAEAKAAGAAEITTQVHGDISSVAGYTANFSEGLWFTAFAGTDDNANQKVYSFRAMTRRATTSDYLSSNTSVYFYGLWDVENNIAVPSYVVSSSDDSYAERNYITILVGADTDLNKEYAVDFRTYDSVTVYTGGTSQEEEPRVTKHSFANGPVQYTASAENKENAKNYWIQVKKVNTAKGQLYISSLEDEESKTRVENGVTYSTRQVMLDSYHDYYHDICLANVGDTVLNNLSAELSSDVVELDEYWNLSGLQPLNAVTEVEENGRYMNNLAKLRLRAKDGVADGTDITGTLTIKADGQTLMVLTLTGMVGNPKITTTEIPDAVKYVPYGAMIQNSNKYSWIDVSYELYGDLPAGMELKPNGELYGVPQETGTFTFTVWASFDSRGEDVYFNSSGVTLTLIVNENTNANVYNETDIAEGYSLETPIGVEVTAGSYDFYLAQIADSLFVSEGVFNEFIDLWLNGQKLERGVDYTAESGSTRITVSAQTLRNKANQTGANTIAAEFRVNGDVNQDLRRTAQNFRMDASGSGSGSGSGSSSGSGSGGSGADDSSSGGGTGAAPGTVIINGRLVDANNNGLAGMTMELHSSPRFTTTDANGNFRFVDVEFGSHELLVRDANGNLLANRWFEIREDGTVSHEGDVFKAPRGTTIHMTVRLADGMLTFSDVVFTTPAVTGDVSDPMKWVLLALLSCAVLTGAVVYNKRRGETR